MGIQGLKDEEVISVYDPEAKVFREKPLAQIRALYEGLGLTKKEIEEKIEKIPAANREIKRKLEKGEM